MTWVLKRLWATAAAIVGGITSVLMGERGSSVELGVGDQAPDFSLPGSDGRAYRLSDSAGAAVVLAWFPKAFTGG